MDGGGPAKDLDPRDQHSRAPPTGTQPSLPASYLRLLLRCCSWNFMDHELELLVSGRRPDRWDE